MPESVSLFDGLNPSQIIAVKHTVGPLLIVAGAGTGKTTVLTRRYVHLLQTGGKDEKPLTTDNLLALTFTEKSAAEMEDRVLQLLPNGTYDFWISTFHGFCQRILERYALEIGLPNHFTLITETDAWLLLKRYIHKLPLDHYRPLGNPVKFLSALLHHLSRAKDEGVTPEQYLNFVENIVLEGEEEFIVSEKARLKELAECYVVYRDLLREEGLLDFGDLIIETLRLLRECPSVLKELREQFRFILIDEFQDTNWAQYELIKLLAGDTKNLTVVGDDDQAIYKFRGASLANILQFKEDFPDASTVTLTDNYRSHQEILDVAYGFITKNNPNRLEIRLAHEGLDKRLQASKGNGGKVMVNWYPRLEDEAEGVARNIIDLKQKDPTLTWNDFVILSRSNDGAEPFIFALERHGVPYRFFASRGLYAKPIILDLVAVLSLCDGTRESTSMWRAMTAPNYAFSMEDLRVFLAYSSKHSVQLWDAVVAHTKEELQESLSESAHSLADRFIVDILKLSEDARRETPLKVFQLAIENTHYLDSIMKHGEEEKIEEIALLNGFVQRLKRYEAATHGPTLKGFLEELRLEIDSGEEGALQIDPDAGPELVKVMTVHASKGLEFRHVFIVSVVDQRFPTRARSEVIPLPDGLINERLEEGNSNLDEERRLMYVAMTRAKESLTLTGAEDYGGARKKKPSLFLEDAQLEIPKVSVKTNSTLSHFAPEKPVSIPSVRSSETFALKRRFSFTQLAAFENCGLQYKFAHVYKIPVLGKYQKSFGQAIHLTFQNILQMNIDRTKIQQTELYFHDSDKFSKRVFQLSLDEAIAIYEARWSENDHWYPDRKLYDEYHTKGREATQRLVEEWIMDAPDVAMLEAPFEWRVGEHSLKGKIDRIDRLPNGHFAILDYKTGNAKKSKELDTGAKEQLWIYQMAMEERGISIDTLTYVYVLDGCKAQVNLLQGQDREEFREALLLRMEEILRSDFRPNPSPFVCKNCDFKHICEFRRL
ncbi:ATP-dependent helicase [Candidatus Uhrbacteria bacterium]|nr:ATP-dependent helicase [Candidatus Uhrbacteria bacterium]